MSISLKADPSGTFGEILVNGAVVAKLPVSGNAVIPGLVGTVSESGGVPTGAIIERGSNANGSYIRYADGTQICVLPRSSTSSSADVTLVFPATFIESPSIASALSTYLDNLRLVHRIPTTTSVTVVGLAYNSLTRVGGGFETTAIGRWF